jgi:hypothetical protein
LHDACPYPPAHGVLAQTHHLCGRRVDCGYAHGTQKTKGVFFSVTPAELRRASGGKKVEGQKARERLLNFFQTRALYDRRQRPAETAEKVRIHLVYPGMRRC